jgi:uncharacterized protein YdeI (BOF family)
LSKLLLLAAFVSIAGIAVAQTEGTNATQPGEAVNSPHGGMLTTTGTGMPPGHSREIPADTQLVNNGTVLEVIDTDTYTYLQVTTEKGPLWLAVYKTKVAKGATVKYSNGVAMSGFYSKSLNRNFDVIVFVDTIEQMK